MTNGMSDFIKSYAEASAKFYEPKVLPKPKVKDEFSIRSSMWYSKADELRKKAGASEERVNVLAQQIQRTTAQIYGGAEAPEVGVSAKVTATTDYLMAPYTVDGITLYGPITETRRKQLRQDITDTSEQVAKDLYYSRVYGELPLYIAIAKSAGGEPSPAVILSQAGAVPRAVSAEEWDQLLADVEEMVEAILPAHEGLAEELPEMALEAETPVLPELRPPEEIAGIPVNINQLTVEEIKKSLMTPLPPPSVLSKEEWITHLVESGQISDEADLEQVDYFRDLASQFILDWQERDNMLKAYRDGIAEMPEFGAVDLLKELVVMPGMGLLDVGRFYFEHVSQPLAGAVWKTLLRPWRPDLEAAYQQYKKEEGTWKALGHAWEEWDVGDGRGAWEWMLKYLLMEGLADPLSYVGWGLATKITRPLGAFGRGVAGIERGIAATFELPFDLMKFPLRARWGIELFGKEAVERINHFRALVHAKPLQVGEYFLPRTLAQRAAIAMHEAGQYVEVALTKRFGKALWQMNKDELRKGITDIVQYTLRYGHQVNNEVTRAGRELLKHVPMTEKEVAQIADRIGTTLAPDQITKHTVETVDRIFEDFFAAIRGKRKLASSKESAARLIGELAGRNTEDNLIIASKILEQRARAIINGALSFSGESSVLKAVRNLMRRNYNIWIKSEESAIALARKEMGSFRGAMADIEYHVQRTWANSIDKWIVRPFAESYLTFALYGPMNVIEDIIRHGLGGAFPGTKTYRALTRKWTGVRIDQTLAMADKGISETLGALRARRPGEINNWILQLGGLTKGFGDNIYKVLVEAPGRVGAGIRIHYIDAMATKLLKEMGGEQFERLAKVATKFQGTSSAKINKQVNQAATELAAVGAIRDSFNALKTEFTRQAILRREVDNILMAHPDMSRTVRDHIMQTFDDEGLFVDAKTINSVMGDSDRLILDDFLNSSEHAHEGFESLANELAGLEVRNPEELAQLMRALNLMSNLYGATPKQVLGRAVEKSRGLPLAERRLTLDKVMDSITVYRERAGASTDKLVEKIRGDLGTIYKDSPDYILGANHLFDLQTAKRLRASELAEEINGYRHNLFAEASPDQLKTNEFWDDYSRELSQRWDDFDVEMAELDAAIDNAIEDLDRIGGIPKPTRAPVKVTGALSTSDIARLLQCRTDDITRTILSEMVAVNSRNHFVAYVMGKVKPGDVGFTKESVGAVYDSLMQELVGGAQHASWVSKQRLELEGVRNELHGLYNSKLLPEGEAEAISRYLDETAGRVEEIMYGMEYPEVPVVISESVRTYWDRNLEHNPLRIMPMGQETDAGAFLSSHLEGAGDILREFYKGRYADRNYIFEKFNRYKNNIRSRDWTDPLSQAELNNIVKVRNLLEGMPVENDFQEFLRGFMFDTINRDVASIESKLPRLRKLINDNLKTLEPGPGKVVLKPEYANYSELKQAAMDEAHKWYYKEFTDYTNANVFDAIMKSIYPFWTYETQRWFWLPRSFVRHPGTFTSFERWQDNTEYGYIHIPGTSVDINPFRGTVYGTLTTRLARRDFPEYYDELDAAGDLLEFNDFISRYGFYPGSHVGLPMSMFTGTEMQFGEVMPAIVKTPLDFLIAAFPDNDSVKWLSDRVFGERFRDYMTIITANRLGGDGTLIFSKMKEDKPLTPEEEQIWADARRQVGLYSAGFEQFALFRMRTDEQYRMYEEASRLIEEMTGYSPEQQDWLRKHNFRLWDMVGGMSDSEQAALEELDYYRWAGQVRPLLPGRQQEILNRVEIGWKDVENYTNYILEQKLQLQRDFQNGVVPGGTAYSDRLMSLYDEQRQYILDRMEQELNKPLPDGLSRAEREAFIEQNSMMTLEGRKNYYVEFNVPQPVLHPMKELANLYFSIKLEETIDPETGAKVLDWTNFWAQRMAIDEAIPDDYKQEWEDFLAKDSTRLEETRREVYQTYFRPYDQLYDTILETYTEEEQQLIEEHLYLQKADINLERREQIENTISERTGNQLISSFRSELSDARRALRYKNPHLDAWLKFWGRTDSFVSPTSEQIYRQISKEVGRKL